MNFCLLIGRVGQDAQLNYTQSGTPVMKLSVATSEPRGSGETRTTHTEWHRCTAFGKYVEALAPKIKKGAEVFIQGKIRTRQWEDKTGVKREATEIDVSTIRMTQEKGRESVSNNTAAAADPFAEGNWGA